MNYIGRDTESDSDLEHFGVLGMKWGVHRAKANVSKNTRLNEKASKYDYKQAKYEKSAERVHSKNDLEKSNKIMNKAEKLYKKAEKINYKIAKNKYSGFKETKMANKAAKINYKSDKLRVKGDMYSKTAGYGIEAINLLKKSNKARAKASKLRYKIAKNDRFLASLNNKVPKLSDQDRATCSKLIDELSKIEYSTRKEG